MNRNYVYVSLAAHFVSLAALTLIICAILFVVVGKDQRHYAIRLLGGVPQEEASYSPDDIEKGKMYEYKRGMYDMCATMAIALELEAPQNAYRTCADLVAENGDRWYHEPSSYEETDK